MSTMPVLFVGHGTPMNAIENNRSSNTWKGLGDRFEKPKAILSISAHWYTEGSFIQRIENPKQIYDMYGFPKELYELKYPAKGDPQLADRVIELLPELTVMNDWGIDHGTWSVLCHIYPEADIPIVQLSIDRNKSFKEHFEMAKKLKDLREEGILLFGTGNILHNLREIEWGSKDMTPKGKEFDDKVHDLILARDFEKLLDIDKDPLFKYAAPTPDHFIPILYILANTREGDKIEVFNRMGELGTISMTSYLLQK